MLIGGPIPEGAEWRKEFDHRLLDVIRKSQRLPILASKRAATAATACLDAACARSLVEKEQVDALLSARVLLGADRPPSYRVSVLVFDRARDDLRSREASCPACSELQAGELLSSLAAQALEGPSAPAITATVPPPATPALAPTLASPPLAPPAAPASPDATRRQLGISLVAIGGAGLVASTIALGYKAAQHGELACDAAFPANIPCPEQRDTTFGIVSSAVVGVLSLGVGIAGAVLLARAKRAPRTLSLALSGRF